MSPATTASARSHLAYRPRQRRPFIDARASGRQAKNSLLYEQLSFCDVADVLRFVNEQWRFLSALTPLQPRYAKQVADEDSLMAVIVAQAMNHGNLLMSRTSDLPCHVLEATCQQYPRLAGARWAANAWGSCSMDRPVARANLSSLIRGLNYDMWLS